MTTDKPSLLHSKLELLLALGIVAGCGDDGNPADDADASGTDGSTTAPSTDSTPGETGVDASSTEPTDGSASETESGACQVTPWEAANWADNTTEALALRAQLDTLVSDNMRAAEEGSVTIDDAADLTALFEAGSPSLADVTTPAFAVIVQDAFEEFVEVVTAGERDLVDENGQWDPQGTGGIFGDSDRGLNEGGIEVRQIVDKGLFGGGALYAHALSLTEGEIDAATIDAIAALWGANEMLDPEGDLTDSANYGYQMGFHGAIAEALTAAKAYAGDPACTTERDAALETVFRQWEQSLIARMVYYANVMVTGLITATTDSELAEALHAHSEGLGLAAGFYGLASPAAGPLSGAGRVITDADLEAIMTAFAIDLDDLGNSSMGAFVESLPSFEDAVAEAEGVVMGVYGVDAAVIQTWRMPTPG